MSSKKVRRIKDSVAAVLFDQDWRGEIFALRRQNHLKAFPGFTSFPGGKIDPEDYDQDLNPFVKKLPESIKKGHNLTHLNALFRELKEELGDGLSVRDIKEVKLLGEATTPDFNPFRFETYFYGVVLTEKIDFAFDSGEIATAQWKRASEWWEDYLKGRILSVVPTLKIFSYFKESFGSFKDSVLNLNLNYDSEKEVPLIETIYGLKQFLPLSNTLFPAERTNCFLIGDKKKVLIDPSPKNYLELDKLIFSLSKQSCLPELVFLTHHHSDHYEHCDVLAKKWNLPLGMSQDTFERICSKKGRNYFEALEIQIFKEGDILTTWQGEDVYVYEIPGHDEGHLGLAPISLKWFLAGDLFQTVGTVVIPLEEGDMKKYLNSLQKVIKLNPTFLIPSHGLAVGGTYILEKIFTHRCKRHEQIKKCTENNMSINEIYEEIYKGEGLNEKLKACALLTIESHLKYINSTF